MKKLVVLLLCLCAALSTACGNNAPAPAAKPAAATQTQVSESELLQTLFGKINLKDSLDTVTKILGPAKTKKDHQESKDANGKTIDNIMETRPIPKPDFLIFNKISPHGIISQI